MENKTIVGGIASEYDDQILWIEKPEVGADAAQIVDETQFTPCTVTNIVIRSNYDDDEEYNEACDTLLNESSALCTGEFVTFDDVYFVELDNTGDTEEYDSIEYDDVDIC